MKVTSVKSVSRISRKIIFTGEEKEIRRNAKKLRTFLRNRGGIPWGVFGPFVDEDKPGTTELRLMYSPGEDKEVIEAINEKGKELGFQI